VLLRSRRRDRLEDCCPGRSHRSLLSAHASRSRQSAIPILYIGGYSRSGSTLLQRLLGQSEEFVCAGELWDVWRRSFVENQLCGCGQPFHACPFWASVVREAFGNGRNLDAAALDRLKATLQEPRHLAWLFLPFARSADYRDDMDLYRAMFMRLYRAVHEVAGGRVIIDASKVPQHAALLSERADVELHVVHLVRDSRATAYSWQRRKRRPEIYWEPTFMDRYGAVRVAVEWTAANILLFRVRPRAKTYVVIRYEDFAERPWDIVDEIRVAMGLDRVARDYRDHAELSVHHTVSGNPNRFDHGIVPIRPDREWETQLSPQAKRVVTALTLPLLKYFGYK
jgi:hypothetical protein